MYGETRSCPNLEVSMNRPSILSVLWCATILVSMGCGKSASSEPLAPSSSSPGETPPVASPSEPATPPVPDKPVTRLIIKETEMGKVSKKIAKDSITVSPDSQHIAWVDVTATPHRVVLDGQPQKPYVGAFPTSLKFSPDSKRFAYAAKTGSAKEQVPLAIVDGIAYPQLYDIGSSADLTFFHFSPDSKHVVLFAVDGDPRKGFKAVAIVDGKLGTRHDGDFSDLGAVWSPGSRHWAGTLINAATRKQRVVIDDVPQQEYDEIMVSNVAVVKNDQFKNTKQHAAELMKHDISFSNDGEHHTYAARRGSTAVLVLDGKELVTDDTLIRRLPNGTMDGGFGQVRISPDGKDVSYVVRDSNRGKAWRVVFGKKHTEYPYLDIGNALSADGKRFAYFAKPDLDHRRAVVDGVEGKDYDAPLLDARPSDLQFSPDGSRFAARYRKGSKTVIAVDGVEGPEFDDLWGFGFSADGKRYGYSAKRGKQQLAVIDGTEGKAYAELNSRRGPGFSPDNRRAAYWAYFNGEEGGVVVDGIESKEKYLSGFGAIVFQSPTKAVALAERNGTLYRLEIELAFE